MKLYEINDKIRELLDMLDEGVIGFEDENGEMQYITEKLDELELDRKKKLENAALAVEELKAEADELNRKAKALKERADAKSNRVDSLKSYIINCMQAFGDKKIDGEMCSLSVSVRDKVEVDSIDLLPREYIRSKTTYEADKKAIGYAIKKGAIIEGARVIKNPSLSIK